MFDKEKKIEFERNEIAQIIAENFRLNDEKYDASDFEWAAYQVQTAGYRKAERRQTYMLKADGSLEMIPTVEGVIAEFKGLVLKYVQDRDLLLVAFKNAVEYAEAELEKKYIGEKK